jgi:type II secretory pathway pseudopilin PulG
MRNTILIGLVVVIVAAAAAAGGFLYGTSVGEARANQVRQNFFSQRAAQGTQGGQGFSGQGGAGGQGFSGQGGAGGQGFFDQGNRQGTVGVVKSINGNTMEVSTRDSVVTVTLTDQTTVEKQATGSLSDIKTGERVVVVGNQDSGGTVTAQSVQLMPQTQQPAGNQSGGNQ